LQLDEADEDHPKRQSGIEQLNALELQLIEQATSTMPGVPKVSEGADWYMCDERRYVEPTSLKTAKLGGIICANNYNNNAKSIKNMPQDELKSQRTCFRFMAPPLPPTPAHGRAPIAPIKVAGELEPLPRTKGGGDKGYYYLLDRTLALRLITLLFLFLLPYNTCCAP
jgi:hypothetical protein